MQKMAFSKQMYHISVLQRTENISQLLEKRIQNTADTLRQFDN